MGPVLTYQRTRVHIAISHIFEGVSSLHPFRHQRYFAIEVGGDSGQSKNVFMEEFRQGVYCFNHILTRDQPYANAAEVMTC